MSAGDKYIRARKFKKGPTDLMYVSTELEYNLNSEDLRFLDMSDKEVPVRMQRKGRRTGNATNAKRYEFSSSEIETLRARCWRPQL